ncbi:MAG: double-strand break repair helicase AddA [Hyphomicrobium sp.]|nr:double-strand break repair helicase AddA [Hyphomicrobium sp.]
MSAAQRIQMTDDVAETTQRQMSAADPAASVWVSANAGTGKTHVLTSRVLRLLLSGTPPASILCLTYTKAAASEMSARVFGSLAKWVTLPDAELDQRIRELTARAPDDDERARARTLFTAAIETPGGFKVQTIHAFSERLLQRFPLEAGVTPGFAILDEATARDLKREAIDAVLSKAASSPSSALGRALQTAIAYAIETRFDEILGDAIANRTWLDNAVRMPEERVGKRKLSGLDRVEHLFRAHFEIADDATVERTMATAADLLSPGDAERLALIFDQGSKKDAKHAAELRAIRDAKTADQRFEALSELLLDSKDAPRRKFATKAVLAIEPSIDDTLSRLSTRFDVLRKTLKALEVLAATMALHHLGDAVLQTYQTLKARRAALDFDDLIVKTRNLLLTGASTEWVLYKLDGGLDHILVDESQDTSPEQWQVVEALAAEFFAGEGSHANPQTIFAVGDEKQSIYSFQGAAPEMFAEMGQRFETLARQAGATWRRIGLDVSFRTVAPVLTAVDAVFRDTSRTPGLTSGTDAIRHIAKRIGHAGRVELWPTEKADPGAETDAWAPLEERVGTEPEVRLANKIAGTIAQWLAHGEELASEGRKLRAGDIMILVRNRRPFAGPMVAALKSRNIAVAGADRLTLTAHIAVSDLISLGHFLTLPEDDLALAEVLKSPLFDLDDDDLLAFAPGRKGTLWKALLDASAVNPRLATAASTLKRWRKKADFAPPFEFWSNLLERDGMRQRLLARLGPEAADPIDEFLSFAIAFDDRAPPSLTSFLSALQSENPELKRDMDMSRDEVRVMTIHGAKGLEAPVVFLPDTCAGRSQARNAGRPLLLDPFVSGGAAIEGRPFVWPVKGAKVLDAIEEARAREAERDDEERNRLLYVAMTRARDRLIVTGYEGKKGRTSGCWYDKVADVLSKIPGSERPEGGPDAPTLILEALQSIDPEPSRVGKSSTAAATTRPVWATTPAPREASLAVPLAPSRLAPYDTDDEGDPKPMEPPRDALAEPAPPRPSSGTGGTSDRFLRGVLTHGLLEHLPELPVAKRNEAALAFVAARAGTLPKRVQTGIVREVITILNDPGFAPLFGPDSRAEVAIAAEIANPHGRAAPLRLTGQIDRLAIVGQTVLIVDYKTNRLAPTALVDVAETYLLQLAAYRLALAAIYPGHTVRAALLWTEAPKLMEIPAIVLDDATARLWRLDRARLDPAPPPT